MSGSVGVLDFFIVEANEYIERLDALLASAGPAGPDVDALYQFSRALRGSATMSRQQGIADVAAALERVVRALRARTLRWEPGNAAIITGTVDDLRILLRGVRGWGPNEDRRAAARVAELGRLAPDVAGPRTPATSHAGGHDYLAAQSGELARALDRAAASPDDHAALAAASDRVRALRGVAALRDLAPLNEVLEAVEHAMKMLELSGWATASAKQRELFASAAAVLRRAARDLGYSGRPDAGMPELGAFHAAVATLAADDAGKGDRIVPIAQLFHDDDGPHVVSAAPHPPTSAAERFRLEVVSLAEHVRAVVAEARANPAPEHRERIAREMRHALRALGSAANGFGEKLVARFAAGWSAQAAALDARALAGLDEAAALLANPATRADELHQALERLAAPRSMTPRSLTPADHTAVAPSRPAAPRPPAAPTAPAPTPGAGAEPKREPIRTPVGRELRDYLQSGIAGFDELERRPLSQPTPVPGEEIVPIESLLYRGRAALQRAAELREQILGAGDSPSRGAVQELFDLIDLALVE
ncbi:MAG TPA: hypothetical protein VF041_05130 [Gemmatimonadaceae bacterium]